MTELTNPTFSQHQVDMRNVLLSLADGAAMEQTLTALRREDVAKPVIFIGTGTCGLGAGAGKTLLKIKEYVTDKNVDVDIIEVGCIGLCVDEPIVDVQLPGKNRISFKGVTEGKASALLDSVFNKKIPADMVIAQHRNTKLNAWDDVVYLDEHPFFAPQTRWVLENCGLIKPGSIDEYIARDGYKGLAKALKNLTPAELCDLVEESGLRGRGGGGFSAGKKWKFALNTAAEQKYFICNADEGDPGAFMDRAVIEGDPYRLLEGLAIAAYGIGATKAYVYIRAEYPLAIERLKESIAEAKAYGLLGKNILDSGFDLDIIIKMGAGAFVCG
ncbi:NADH-quinone oxidoreductase subunit F, partial [bacterium]|nr:NADH-quinone oxidoreductase subunit F [bacterium]